MTRPARPRARFARPRTPRLVLERMVDQLVEAALRPAGAQIGDVVRALFSLLSETPSGISDEDFTWLADLVRDPSHKPTAAQAYLAAYTLPPSLSSELAAAQPPSAMLISGPTICMPGSSAL